MSADPYVWHWLAVTGALFLLSAVAFALRLRRQSRIISLPASTAKQGWATELNKQSKPETTTNTNRTIQFK